MKKKFFQIAVNCLLISTFFVGRILADNLPSPFIIIPQPQKITLSGGPGLSPATLQHLILTGDLERPVLGNLLSQLTIGSNPGSGSLILTLDKTLSS
jgi:hypothetical protein